MAHAGSCEEMIMSQRLAPYSVPTKMLLPIDFSSSSDAALQMATDLAQHFHAELCLLHVVPIFSLDSTAEYVPDTEFLQDARNRGEQRLEAYVAVLVAKGLVARSVIEIGNDVVGSIMSVVEREQIDMMVLSTHGTSGWRAVVFGSVAEKVVKLLQCPLLLLHSPKTAVATESFTSMATAFPLTTPIHTS
jgi:nucleotide-binding universal stress UspA family protein